jgi:hypothetical protein
VWHIHHQVICLPPRPSTARCRCACASSRFTEAEFSTARRPRQGPGVKFSSVDDRARALPQA